MSGYAKDVCWCELCHTNTLHETKLYAFGGIEAATARGPLEQYRQPTSVCYEQCRECGTAIRRIQPIKAKNQ